MKGIRLFISFIFFVILFSAVNAEQISVTSFNQDVFKSYIKKAILSDFKDLKDPIVSTEVKTLSIFEDIPTSVHYVFIDFAKAETFLGKVLLDIVFLSEDNKIIASHKCLVESELSGKVFVASTKLSKNTIIKQSDISLVEKEIRSAIIPYISNKDLIVGKQTKKKMTAGIMFSDKWIEMVPVIKKGDPVFAIVKSPAYEIKCEGIALQSGNIGEMIQLKSSLSKKILRGEILNEKSILVTTN